MLRRARKRVVVRRKNVNRGANAELLRLRQHRQELVEALQSLSHLLDEYAPTWYSEEHRELTVAAQVDAQRGTAEELAFRVYGRAHVARPQTRRGNSTSPALKLFAAGQKGM
jgi:hypothetical protein